jgi:Ca2+-binding EF-hand superfamily protein
MVSSFVSASDAEKKLREMMNMKHKNARDMFHELEGSDVGHSGVLTPDNFRKTLVGLGIQLKDEEWATFLAHFGSDGAETIDYSHLVARLVADDATGPSVMVRKHSKHKVHATLGSQPVSAKVAEEKLKELLRIKYKDAQHMFRGLDLNHNGQLDASELRKALVSHDIHLADDQWPEFENYYDVDHNGKITFADLVARITDDAAGEPDIMARRGSEHKTHAAAQVQRLPAAIAIKRLKEMLRLKYKNAAEMFRGLDTDHNGQLDADDFRKFTDSHNIFIKVSRVVQLTVDSHAPFFSDVRSVQDSFPIRSPPLSVTR